MVDTSDLKSDFLKSIGSSPIMSKVLYRMPTINQLLKNKRFPIFIRTKVPALQSCPQKQGVCIKILTRTPKKPNSAIRKLVKLKLSNNKVVDAYIPGEGQNVLQEYATVLIQGGRVKDLPGIKYKLIRGKLDFLGLSERKTSRSLYGTKKNNG